MREARNRAKRIEHLVTQLGGLDQRAALRAEGRLIHYGTLAVEALMEATASENPQVRFRAVWALGKIGDQRALALIRALTNDPDARVAYDAATVLQELNGGVYVAGNAEAIL